MFIAAQFTIAETWKQIKCASTYEWINKRYIYTMEYYSAIKNGWNNAMTFTSAWIQLEAFIRSEVPQKEKDKHHFTYMWNLKYSTIEPICKMKTDTKM